MVGIGTLAPLSPAFAQTALEYVNNTNADRTLSFSTQYSDKSATNGDTASQLNTTVAWNNPVRTGLAPSLA